MPRVYPDTMPKKPDEGLAFPDLLSAAGWDLLYGIKIILVVFLRWLFEKSFVDLEWQLDDKKSDVIIGDKHQTYSPSVHKKPRIIVDRGAIRWENISFNKEAGSGFSGVPLRVDGVTAAGSGLGTINVGGFERSRALSQTVDVLSGSVNIICYAEEGLLAERMASFVFTAIRAHRKMLREMGFLSIDSSGVGRESLEFATSNHRMVAVPVTVRFSLSVTMTTEYIEDALEDCGLFEQLRVGTLVMPSMKPCGSGEYELVEDDEG